MRFEFWSARELVLPIQNAKVNSQKCSVIHVIMKNAKRTRKICSNEKEKESVNSKAIKYFELFELRGLNVNERNFNPSVCHL